MPNCCRLQRRLVEQLGGRVHDVVAPSPAEGLVSFAHAEKATQLVLGSSRRSRLHEVLHGSFAGRVIRSADGIDVHVIADQDRSEAAVAAVVARPRRWQPSAPSPGMAVDGDRIAVADCGNRSVPKFDRV